MWQKIKNAIETRIGLDEIVSAQLKHHKVPEGVNVFYALGIVTLVAYMVQAITGYFLMIYYVPHSEYAFSSVQLIMNTVPFGWFVRMIHVVVSNLMVVVIFLHLISIFVMLSYKKPREFTWVAGGCLLFITLLFCLSGYLLPWSQRSYWATTIVTNIPTAFPIVGDYIANLLKGGESVSGVTLGRFFALHVAFLPPIFLFIVGLHLFLVNRVGLSSPPFNVSGTEEKPWTEYIHASRREGYPIFPYYVLKQAFMVMVFFAVTFFIISFMPTLFLSEAANTPADPFKTPLNIRPEWYFLAPYQMLKLIPNKFLGISVQLILFVVFLLWPFFDTKRERNIFMRPVLLGAFFLLLTAWVALTIWGGY